MSTGNDGSDDQPLHSDLQLGKQASMAPRGQAMHPFMGGGGGGGAEHAVGFMGLSDTDSPACVTDQGDTG